MPPDNNHQKEVNTSNILDATIDGSLKALDKKILTPVAKVTTPGDMKIENAAHPLDTIANAAISVGPGINKIREPGDMMLEHAPHPVDKLVQFFSAQVADIDKQYQLIKEANTVEQVRLGSEFLVGAIIDNANPSKKVDVVVDITKTIDSPYDMVSSTKHANHSAKRQALVDTEPLSPLMGDYFTKRAALIESMSPEQIREIGRFEIQKLEQYVQQHKDDVIADTAALEKLRVEKHLESQALLKQAQDKVIRNEEVNFAERKVLQNTYGVPLNEVKIAASDNGRRAGDNAIYEHIQGDKNQPFDKSTQRPGEFNNASASTPAPHTPDQAHLSTIEQQLTYLKVRQAVLDRPDLDNNPAAMREIFAKEQAKFTAYQDEKTQTANQAEKRSDQVRRHSNDNLVESEKRDPKNLGRRITDNHPDLSDQIKDMPVNEQKVVTDQIRNHQNNTDASTQTPPSKDPSR